MPAPLPDADRELLDRLAADACPPLEQVEVDGWRLRAARGVLRRANSTLPYGDALPLDAVVEFYAARGLPAAVQVSDERLDARLADLGWRRETEVLVLQGPAPAGPPGDVRDTADDAWLRCWDAVDGRGGGDVVRECLARITAPAGYARVEVDGRTVAVGRGVVQEGRLGVFSMAVLPEHRRQGLGRQVLGALGAWAAGLGATSSYLQVEAGSTAALALYGGAGLLPAYGYGYRYGPPA